MMNMDNNIFDKINRYENDNMEYDEVISFFQELLDTGILFSLQGSYQRTAKQLLEQDLLIIKA